MSFFSKSSKGQHYKNGNYGYNHYKQKGLLGDLFNTILSGSNSKGYPVPYQQQYPNQHPCPAQQPQPNPQPYTNPSSYIQQQNQQLQTNHPIQNQQVWHQNNPICSKCKSKIPAGSKFCLECEERVSDILFCTNCKEKLPPNAKFCLNYGTKV